MKFKQEIPCHIAIVNDTVYFSKTPFIFEGVRSHYVNKVCHINIKNVNDYEQLQRD